MPIKQLALSALLLTLGPVTFAQTPPANDAVYQAWGGKTGIRTVMEDFVPRLFTDKRIGKFFTNADRENLITQLTDQLCQESGGPCVYKGAAMGRIHAELGIQKSDFNALVEILQVSMDAKGIPFSAQNGMLARLAPMHRDIIAKE
jgi:hemoglobin